jgi:hypothetical protein
MSLYLPDPVPPGTVAQAQLDKVRELHGAVRDWIARSAEAQQNDRLWANLPYVDLMFAAAFATLGDHAVANRLVEAARAVMELPAPPQRDPEKDPDPVIVELVRRFLFKALRSRVLQAIAGKPHTGPLSDDVRVELDEINRIADQGPVNNSYFLAAYVIDRFRSEIRLLEPSERVNVYARWTERSPLPRGKACRQSEREPLRLPPGEALTELANPDCRLLPVQYAQVARSHVRALSEGAGSGLEGLIDLFRRLQPKAITNEFTTAHLFSRLHLRLVDETVLAACRLSLGGPLPATVSV